MDDSINRGEGHGGETQDRRRPRGRNGEDPGQRTLTTRQARYLADLSDRDPKELLGRPVAAITDELRFHLDSTSWFYHRVCGRVVRTDPTTGEKAGVPFATVHVEDTDCTFLGLFPVEHPTWWWAWPLRCDREVITTTTTDECGNFCVLIPRWEIDRVLRLRRERQCFPEIGRPRLPDLDRRVPIPVPDPLPDPFPRPPTRFGAPVPPAPAIGALRAAPPLDEGALDRARQLLRDLPRDTVRALDLDADDGAAPDVDALARVARPARAIGPFVRCRDVVVAEWELLLDVPDVTFRVTQDVDGDGVEEEIYTEGWFDVRWNETDIPDVELEASPLARATTACGLDPVPCADEPALLQVGRMPAVAPYLDGDGYATRVNRPRLGGQHDGPSIGAARTPVTGELQLSGCYDTVDGAAFFRVLNEFAGVETPITGVSWIVGATTSPFWIEMVPDADGWYAVADAQRQVDPHLVMSWPVAGRGSGRHGLRLEVADSSRNQLAVSPQLPLQVDDRVPLALLASVRWRTGASTPWADAPELVGVDCPVVERPVGDDVELRVQWSVSADHWRDATLRASGCGASSDLVHTGGVGSAATVDGTTVGRWHATTAETGMTRTDTYVVQASSAQGAYAVSLETHGRAFVPAGGTGPSADWFVDPSHRRRWTALRFAVIDA